MRRKILLFAALAATPAIAASPEREGFKKLSGSQIRSAFAGRTFTDDTHFSFRYMSGGTIGGTSMGKPVKNKWAVNSDRLCVTDSFGETCYKVWKKGRAVKLTIGESDLSIDGMVK